MGGGESQGMARCGARWLCAVVLDESEVMRRWCRSNGEGSKGGKHGAVAYGFDEELPVEQGEVVGAGR